MTKYQGKHTFSELSKTLKSATDKDLQDLLLDAEKTLSSIRAKIAVMGSSAGYTTDFIGNIKKQKRILANIKQEISNRNIEE
jgi:hypothetical protein